MMFHFKALYSTLQIIFQIYEKLKNHKYLQYMNLILVRIKTIVNETLVTLQIVKNENHYQSNFPYLDTIGFAVFNYKQAYIQT